MGQAEGTSSARPAPTPIPASRASSRGWGAPAPSHLLPCPQFPHLLAAPSQVLACLWWSWGCSELGSFPKFPCGGGGEGRGMCRRRAFIHPIPATLPSRSLSLDLTAGGQARPQADREQTAPGALCPPLRRELRGVRPRPRAGGVAWKGPEACGRATLADCPAWATRLDGGPFRGRDES